MRTYSLLILYLFWVHPLNADPSFFSKTESTTSSDGSFGYSYDFNLDPKSKYTVSWAIYDANAANHSELGDESFVHSNIEIDQKSIYSINIKNRLIENNAQQGHSLISREFAFGHTVINIASKSYRLEVNGSIDFDENDKRTLEKLFPDMRGANKIIQMLTENSDVFCAKVNLTDAKNRKINVMIMLMKS